MLEEHRKVIASLVEKCSGTIQMYKFRWDSEKEYEDWQEYKDAMTNLVTKVQSDIKITKITKVPFGIHVVIPGIPWNISILWNKASATAVT